MRSILMLLLVLPVWLPLVAQAETTLPVSGPAVPELVAFDDAMLAFMDEKGIEAGLLGVMKDGVVVLERGYGWQDSGHAEGLPATAMMRIASVTKPLTAAAIRRLVDQGLIGLDDYVFDLGQAEGGLLGLTPFLSLGDARLADITVQHLLDQAVDILECVNTLGRDRLDRFDWTLSPRVRLVTDP